MRVGIGAGKQRAMLLHPPCGGIDILARFAQAVGQGFPLLFSCAFLVGFDVAIHARESKALDRARGFALEE